MSALAPSDIQIAYDAAERSLKKMGLDKEEHKNALKMLEKWRKMRKLQITQKDPKKLAKLKEDLELQIFIFDFQEILGENYEDFQTQSNNLTNYKPYEKPYKKPKNVKEGQKYNDLVPQEVLDNQKFWLENYNSVEKPEWWVAPTINVEWPNYIKFGDGFWVRPDLAQKKIEQGQYKRVTVDGEVKYVPSNAATFSFKKRDNRSSFSDGYYSSNHHHHHRDLDEIADSLYENVDQLMEYVHQQNDIIDDQSEQIAYLEREILNLNNSRGRRRRHNGRRAGVLWT